MSRDPDRTDCAVIYRDNKTKPWQLQAFTATISLAHRTAQDTLEQERGAGNKTFEIRVLKRDDYEHERFSAYLPTPIKLVCKIKSTEPIKCGNMPVKESEDLSFLDHKGFDDFDV